MGSLNRLSCILAVTIGLSSSAIFPQASSLKAIKAVISDGIFYTIQMRERDTGIYRSFDLTVKDEGGTRKAIWPGGVASRYTYNAMRWDIFDGSVFSISVGLDIFRRNAGFRLNKVSLTEWDTLKFHGAALNKQEREKRRRFLNANFISVHPVGNLVNDPLFQRSAEQYRPGPVYFDFVIVNVFFKLFILVDNQIAVWELDGSGWAHKDDPISVNSGFIPNWQSLNSYPAPFQGPFNVVRHGGQQYLIDDTGGIYQVGSTLSKVCQTTAPLGKGILLAHRDADQVVFIPNDKFNLEDLEGSIRNGVMLLPLLTPSTSGLSPATVSPGSGDFTLTVNGSNFPNGSTAHWNGSPRVTTFISSTQLQAAILAADVTVSGTASVSVVSPCGTTSNSLTFTIIEAPPENVLSVPAQYATIQAAVDASQPGDIIEVSTGFYNELVSIANKDSISLRTTGSPDGVTCKGFLLKQSHYITIKGFVVDASGTSDNGIVFMGGNNQNADITLEANTVKNAGNDFGGISIARGNPRTRIVNNRIHNNGRNGIRIIDATGGPHYLINNTIVQNGWNGVEVARQHVIYLVNNILSFNGTKPGSTGGRYGVSREAMTDSGEAAGITLLNNLIVGNHGNVTSSSSQDIGNYAQTLDATDSGNLTTAGDEGNGVSASPTAEFADVFVSQTPLDLHLKASSVAIDRGLNNYNPPNSGAGSIPTNDFDGEGRPKGAAVDIGADESP